MKWTGIFGLNGLNNLMDGFRSEFDCSDNLLSGVAGDSDKIDSGRNLLKVLKYNTARGGNSIFT